jgi:hypothetical protein
VDLLIKSKRCVHPAEAATEDQDLGFVAHIAPAMPYVNTHANGTQRQSHPCQALRRNRLGLELLRDDAAAHRAGTEEAMRSSFVMVASVAVDPASAEHLRGVCGSNSE